MKIMKMKIMKILDYFSSFFFLIKLMVSHELSVMIEMIENKLKLNCL